MVTVSRICDCGCGKQVTSRRADARYATPGCRLRAWRARPAADRSAQDPAAAAAAWESWSALVPISQWFDHLVVCMDLDHEDARKRGLELPDTIHGMRFGQPAFDLSELQIRGMQTTLTDLVSRGMLPRPAPAELPPPRPEPTRQTDLEAAVYARHRAQLDELAAEAARLREELAEAERAAKYARADKLAAEKEAKADERRAIEAIKESRKWYNRVLELEAAARGEAPAPREVQEVRPAALLLVDVLAELPQDLDVAGRKPSTWAKLVPQAKAPPHVDAAARAAHFELAAGPWWTSRPHWRSLEALGLAGLHGREVSLRLEQLQRDEPRAFEELAQLLAGRRDFAALTSDRPRRLAALVLAHRRPSGSPLPDQHPAGPADPEGR